MIRFRGGPRGFLIATLADPGYPAVVERAMSLRVEALDWNRPRHLIA